jgi:hypothetical protein
MARAQQQSIAGIISVLVLLHLRCDPVCAACSCAFVVSSQSLGKGAIPRRLVLASTNGRSRSRRVARAPTVADTQEGTTRYQSANSGRVGREDSQEEYDTVQSVRSCPTLPELKVLLLELTSSESASTQWTPNVAAAVLRRTTQQLRELERQSRFTLELRAAVKDDLLPAALKRIVSSLTKSDSSSKNNNNNSMDAGRGSGTLNAHAASDSLVALSILLATSRRGTPSFEKLAPVQLLLWGRLEDALPETVKVLSPRRLAECLLAVRPLPDAIQSDLYLKICHRLSQGDALGKLSSREMGMILRSFLFDREAESGEDEESSESARIPPECHAAVRELMRCIARRYRKRKVRDETQDWSLIRVIQTTRRLWYGPILSTAPDDIREEMQLMMFTLARHVICPLNGENVVTRTTELSATDIATICHAANTMLKVDASDVLVQRKGEGISLPEIANILAAFEKWQVNEQPLTVQQLSVIFQRSALEDATAPPSPRDINTILRCSGLLYSNDRAAMHTFLTTARKLFLNQIFLDKSNALHLSNFLWFAAFKSNHFFDNDEDVLAALAERTLKDDIVENCTPKLASRILNSYSCLIYNTNSKSVPEASRITCLMGNLFERFGEHLLSTQMTPLDASSAIGSYIRASYVYDLGIFDNLIKVLANQLNDCYDRQVSQSLWACGKLSMWENVEDLDGNDIVQEQKPPYLDNAIKLARHLSKAAPTLTQKGVAQALWGMARLQIDDTDIVGPLMLRARTLSLLLSSQELANILWAASKLRSTDFKTVFVLTRPFASEDGAAKVESVAVTPQEASIILFALGKLDIRDENVFKNLSLAIMDNINVASAQAIAMTIEAHRAVYLEPPQRLMDAWVSRKLGIVPISDPKLEYSLVEEASRLSLNTFREGARMDLDFW